MNIYLGHIWIENNGIKSLFEYRLVQAESERLAQDKFDIYAKEKVDQLKQDERTRNAKLVLAIIQPTI